MRPAPFKAGVDGGAPPKAAGIAVPDGGTPDAPAGIDKRRVPDCDAPNGAACCCSPDAPDEALSPCSPTREMIPEDLEASVGGGGPSTAAKIPVWRAASREPELPGTGTPPPGVSGRGPEPPRGRASSRVLELPDGDASRRGLEPLISGRGLALATRREPEALTDGKSGNGGSSSGSAGGIAFVKASAAFFERSFSAAIESMTFCSCSS